MSQPERNDPCPCDSGKKFKKCCMNNPSSKQVIAAQSASAIQELQREAEQHHLHQGHEQENGERLAVAKDMASSNAPDGSLLWIVSFTGARWPLEDSKGLSVSAAALFLLGKDRLTCPTG